MGKGVLIMVTAIVLLTVTKSLIKEIAEEIAEIERVSEVYSITGLHDLAAIVRAPDSETLADVITSEILKIGGIMNSETMFAFKFFSRHDLEEIFGGRS